MTRCGSRNRSLTVCGVIAHGADRTTAQPDRRRRPQERRQHDRRIHRRIEKLVEMIVRKRLVVEFCQHRQPFAVGDEHQEGRRVHDPRHVGNGRDDAGTDCRVGDDDDVALLQVALGRRRKRAGAQQPQQVGREWRAAESAGASDGRRFGRARSRPGSAGSIAMSSPKRSASAAAMAFNRASSDISSDMNLLRRWIEEFHRSARNLTRWRRHPLPAQSLDRITFFRIG